MGKMKVRFRKDSDHIQHSQICFKKKSKQIWDSADRHRENEECRKYEGKTA